MNKSPAFQFYAAEFLADENVVMMSNQELGCYIKLMCYCWREGSIPNDTSKIAKLCGENSSDMAELWLSISTCFIDAINDEKRLVHPRLEKERDKQKKFKEERSESGKKGAEAKWGKASKTIEPINGSAIPEPMAKNSSSSSFSSSFSINTPLPPKGIDLRFDKFWAVYPKKVGKKAAKKSFDKIKPDETLLTTMLKSVQEQAKSDAWRKDNGQYIPDPAKWLNQGRWEDEGVVLNVVSKPNVRDPALVKAENDLANAKPPSLEVLAKMAALRKVVA